MRFLLVMGSIVFNLTFSFGQNTSGITQKQDTSFTKTQALKSAIGTFPHVKLAQVNFNDLQINIEKDIIYSKNNNLALDIFSPKSNTKPHIGILLIHGGGWRSGDRSNHHEMAAILASRGYVVLTPAYRLSTHALYPAAVTDLKTAIKYMRANAEALNIDPNKISAVGFSAGGQLAALMGSTSDEKFFESETEYSAISAKINAVVDIDGILAFIHPESGEGDDTKNTSAATHWFGYSKTENPTLWQQASALNHVSAGDPPILFLNSSQSRMHAGREDMILKMNALGIHSEVYTFNGAPHSFCMLNKWFLPTVNRIDAFLDENLGK